MENTALGMKRVKNHKPRVPSPPPPPRLPGAFGVVSPSLLCLWLGVLFNFQGWEATLPTRTKCNLLEGHAGGTECGRKSWCGSRAGTGAAGTFSFLLLPSETPWLAEAAVLAARLSLHVQVSNSQENLSCPPGSGVCNPVSSVPLLLPLSSVLSPLFLFFFLSPPFLPLLFLSPSFLLSTRLF